MKFKFALSVMMGKLARFGLITAGKSATALPGNVALRIEPEMLKVVNERCKKKIIVTGTNGKTTTNNLINHILGSKYENVLSNLKGANMPQGIASTFLENLKEEYDWGVFEVDEGSFTKVVRDIEPDYILITNFFRDQLDRYGEIENTVSMVYETIKPLKTSLILNADDPLVSQFKKLNKNNIFYGVKKNQFSSEDGQIVETRNCPSCSNYIDYDYFNYGQLGSYYCKKCGFKNPLYDYFITNIEYKNNKYCFDIASANEKIFKDICFNYEGIYNIYNCCAAFAFCSEIGIEPSKIIDRMENFDYKLGRMEEINFLDKIVKITLVKNPIGLSEVIKSISHDERSKSILFILNDNPADGQDISWIWDAELSKFGGIKNLKTVYCSGKRAEDIALRLKYVNTPTGLIKIDDDMQKSIKKAVHEDVEIVYILPTYTAVFQTRDIVLSLTKENKNMELNIYPNSDYLPLIGVVIIIMGFLFFIFHWLMLFLIGISLIVYGTFQLSKKHNIKIIVTRLILLSCFFIYNYVGYFGKSTFGVSNLDISHSDRILVIAPHPDDEALGCAGIISRAVNKCIPIATVVMTTGDGFKEGVVINSRSLRPKSPEFIEYGIKRYFEDINAMKKLGLNQNNIYFLGYPDRGMQYLFDTNWDENKPYMGINGVDHVPYSFAYQINNPYCGNAANKSLESIIKSFKPTIVIYPGPGEDHPDHWATHNFVNYTTAKMSYNGKKLNYVLHNNYAPGKYLLPPKKLSELNAKWLTFNLTSNEVFSKETCINAFSSQKIINILLKSFIRQNELFSVYPEMKISQNQDEVNFFENGMPTVTFVDLTWNHNLIIIGLEYTKNDVWIVLETKNRIKKTDIYNFHFRIFNNANVNRADIKVQNGKATSEIKANDSTKINSIITKIKQNKLIVKMPSSLFNSATAFMYNLDIIKSGNLDRSNWFKFDIL